MRKERQGKRKKGRRKEGKWEGERKDRGRIWGEECGKGRESGECCLPTPYTLEPAQNPIPDLTMTTGAGHMAASLWMSFSFYHE